MSKKKDKEEKREFIEDLERIIKEDNLSKEDCEIAIEILKKERLKAMGILTR